MKIGNFKIVDTALSGSHLCIVKHTAAFAGIYNIVFYHYCRHVMV